MGILVDLIECRKARAKQTVLIADDDPVLMSLQDAFVKSEFPGMARQLAYNWKYLLKPFEG